MHDIFERWPILKHPNAHTLIEEDYAYLKLSAQKLTLENWKTFFENLLIICPPKKDDHNAKSLLELLQLDDLTESRYIFLHKYTHTHTRVRAISCTTVQQVTPLLCCLIVNFQTNQLFLNLYICAYTYLYTAPFLLLLFHLIAQIAELFCS